jgi:hypothetical protein
MFIIKAIFCSGHCFQNGSSLGNNVWEENDIISMNVDLSIKSKKTLCFMRNDIMEPVSYGNIPENFKFYV